jgi:peptidoglycan/xylan/chitin deacetylase (PgdA/CDA1 family)
MATVTLSFDNGPDPGTTPGVLQVLAQRAIRASFFVVGQRLEDPRARAIAERAAGDGHLIGNHSYTHKIPLGEDPRDDVVEREIASTDRMLGALAGARKMFRPFGRGGKIGPHLLSRAAAEHLIANRYSVILWNSVPEDWIQPDHWAARALADCAALEHTLVVLHDIVPEAMRHLDGFIAAALDAGHSFTQDFPAACVPIDRGVARADLTGIVAS